MDVLAEIVKKFRDTHLNFGNIPSDTNSWSPVSIDPFHYSTQSQVAMNFVLVVNYKEQLQLYQQLNIVIISVKLVFPG